MKNLYLLLFCFLLSLTSTAQICEPNMDFETGTTANWTFYRGTNQLVGTTPTFVLTTCAAQPGLHTITSGSTGVDPYGGFPIVGNGLHSIKIGEDTLDNNADAVEFKVHVPVGSYTSYLLTYRRAVVFEDPLHSFFEQPRFEVKAIDSATGALVAPCDSYTYISSNILPGFSYSTVYSPRGFVSFSAWSPGSINLVGMGGKTIIVRFSIGGCTRGCHFGYAYIDMDCSFDAAKVVGCLGGTATLGAPATSPHGGYRWTDSLTYTAYYGSARSITMTIPTVTTTYAVVVYPSTGYGCIDTFYTRLVPSYMVPHKSRDTTICVGSTVKMWGGVTDTTALKYSWAPGTGLSCTSCDTTFATPPPGLHAYKIVTTNTGGCLITDTVNVRVHPIPVAISGNRSICIGLTSTVSNATPGGDWSCTNTAIATIGSSSGIVTGHALGTATITYSFSGLCPVYATVTVQPLPSAIAGTPVLCLGYSTTLSNGPGAGTWSSSNTFIAPVGSTSGIVSGVAMGIATITWTHPGTTCLAMQTVTVVAPPGPSSGITSICRGSSTTLLNTGGGIWTSSNTLVATPGLSTGVVTGVSAGTANITYSIGTGCYVTTIMNVLPTPAAITGSPAVCTGLTSALTSATFGGAWSTSDPFGAPVSSTGIVTGISPGTSLVSYSLPSGCRATATVTVSPTPKPISGIKTVCVGQLMTLSDTLSGGTWSTSGTAIGTIGSSTGIVTGIAPGTLVATYSITSTGCTTTAAVTVHPNPLPITGITSLCTGTTSILSNATTGGTWTSSAPSVTGPMMSFSGGISGLSIGTATVTYKLSTGCLSTSTVTVSPVPGVISGTPRVCVGATTILSNATTGGAWTSGNTTIATVNITTGDVSGVAAGTTTITYTIGLGCIASTIVTVNTSPAAIAGATGLCVGATSALSSSPGGGIWSSGNTTVATVSSLGIVSALAPGSSLINYRIFSTGCVAAATVNVIATPGSITGTPTVCVGASAALSNATPGGIWSSSNSSVATVGPAGMVAGMSAGTATITYSLGVGCAVTAIVTVNPTPVITGPATMPDGGSVIFTSSIPGSTWSSSSFAIAISISTGIAIAFAPGVATVVCWGAMGCSSSTVLTVIPSPRPIAGLSNLCIGGTTTLSNATPGGVWTSSNSAISAVGSSSGIVSGILTGTSAITYSLGPGVYTTKVVTVFPLPSAISGPGGLCIGSSVSLSSSSSGGWWTSSSSTTATIGATSGIVTGVTTGSATITYMLSTGCYTTATVAVVGGAPPITGTSGVCSGATTCLSNAAAGGTWSISTTTVATIGASSGCVNGLSAGTAIVTYTPAAGCYTTTTVTVNGPMPAIGGTPGVCSGASTCLSVPSPGGTWSTSSTGIATVVALSGCVTGISPGFAVITYTPPTGCITTATVAVNAAPSPVSGPIALCNGLSAVFNNATLGGVWSTSNTTIAIVDPVIGLVTGVSVGSVDISYTMGPGCIAAMNITVRPVAPVAGADTICAGTTTVFTNAISGGMWTSSNPAVATVGSGSGIVSGAAAGTATIAYRTALGCLTSRLITIEAVPSPGPITGPLTVCDSTSATLTDAVPGGVWTLPGTVATIDPSSGVVQALLPGTATVTYSVTNLCGSATTTAVITVIRPPVAGTIFGVKDVCAGSFVTLSSTAAGGVWSSMNSTVAVDSLSGSVTGIAKGTAIISYSVTNICGTRKTLHTLTINPLPVAGTISGATNVCIGSSIALTNPVGGGAWAISNTNAAISVGLVTGIAPGMDTIRYTTTNMCGSATTLHYMLINPLPNAGALTGPADVCAGASIALTSSVSGGMWSSPGGSHTVGSASGFVTGIYSGTALVTYTVANSCGTDKATHLITVNPLPTAGTVTGPIRVCAGATITLSSNAGGGTWSTGHTLSVIVDGVITGLLTGVDTANYIVTNICGTAIAEHPFVIDPLPFAGAIHGPSVVCTGTPVTFANDVNGGLWSNMGAFITISATGTISGITDGLATISYSVTNICGTATVIKDLTVVSPPTVGEITGPSEVCSGSSVTLSCATSGGAWTGKSGIVDVSGGVVSGLGVGMDSVFYGVTNVCGNAVATKVITVNPLPDAGTITASNSLCAGDTIAVQASVNGGVWSVRNFPIISLTTGASKQAYITGLSSGTDTVTYSVANVCGTAIASQPITVRSAAECNGQVAGQPFDCSGNGELIIYPNPNPGIVSINVSSDIDEHVTINIVNMLGQKLELIETLTNKPMDMKLNVPTGIYLVTVISEHGKCSRKISVVR